MNDNKKLWIIYLLLIIAVGIIGCSSSELADKQEEQLNSKMVEEAEVKKVQKVEESNTNETLSEKNAVGMAKNYINSMAFSKKGLIEQLVFEGFSTEDATYAVNKINVDWKEQAVIAGNDYLDTMSFSKGGLIEQLEFDGFSNEEATYAVNQIGF